MALDPRELDFAYNYISNPNAYQAALDAGYADSTAKHAYEWLIETPPNPTKKRHAPYKPELDEYIQKLRGEDDRESKAILSRTEKKEILAQIARDPNTSVSDRIRAMDIDNKMDGEYVTKLQGEVNLQPKLEDLL